jgi:CO/xanthine dehydrogenase Mo-binding subunit
MSKSASISSLDRRHLLKGAATFGGGLVLSLALPPVMRPAWAATAGQSFAPNAFIRIDHTGAVTLVMPMVEMGQGVYTALSMIIAEELEVDLGKVRLEHAPPNDALYANAILHIQTTGLSSSVRAFWTPLRQAGAVARTLLIAAAAKRWGVASETCRADRGRVYDAGSRYLPYGELVEAASALPIPKPDEVALKQPEDFTLIDLAAAVKQDPVSYRRSLLGQNPRALGVLNLAAERSGWGQPLPAGSARGIALQSAFGGFMSLVAEVEVTPNGTVKVRRLVCAVDCGIVVNPDTIAAQVEGGTMFGLTAALYGAITLKNGRVEQSNFNDYRPIRMNEAPRIETYIVKSAEAPGGFGEAPCAIVAPAVTNAIFAATGKRIRTPPIDPLLLKS